MKRRTFLTGLAATAAFSGSGLLYRRWNTRYEVRHQSLAQFNPEVEFDVCVVGTGPAGSTLAERLSDAGRRVLLLESGVSMSDSNGMQATAALDVYSSSGDLDYPLQGSRFRALGGTSNIWTGRCPRMQPSDFSSSPLAPPQGWPVTYKELQTFYRKAEETLYVEGGKLTASHAPRLRDLPEGDFRDIELLRALLEPLDIAIDHPPTSNKHRFFDDHGPVRFGRDVLPSLSRRSNVNLLSNTTATRILVDSNGHVAGIQAQSMDGVNKTLTAKRYVVACGGVESIRLLLLSGDDHFPDGLGNRGGCLGCNFMEHPFISYTADIPGIEPLDKWLLGRTYQFCEPLRKQGKGGVLLGFYSEPPYGLKIALGIEMAPVTENRIRLNTDKQDAFGNSGADIQLAFSDRDQALWEAGDIIVRDIYERLGAKNVQKLEASLHWSHHHMGGTRMSVEDTDGVVDPNLRVHGTDNLYVLSSSVFVTSGVANPTLTITALSHRLAEHFSSL